eukprot:scaffold27707_cov166-Skeletonema_menzelii.AAC.2
MAEVLAEKLLYPETQQWQKQPTTFTDRDHSLNILTRVNAGAEKKKGGTPSTMGLLTRGRPGYQLTSFGTHRMEFLSAIAS